mgnify:CR=1 FL=1
MRITEGMTLEKLQVIIQAQTKEYMEAMNKVQQQTAKTTNKVEGYAGKIKSAFGKIGKVLGIALSVAAIVNFGKQCIELGSDLAEVQNVVDVTFGALNREVEEFAQNALEQFGLSELSAKQYTSTMGAMLKSMGFTTRAAADMSMELTGLAGDVASFYNLSGDEAFAKIRSGISGETEPLKQLGINLSVANLEQFALTQGMTKSYNAMNQQEQALLRYNYLLSVTSDAQGDFARTSDSWANQTKILTERFNSLKAAIGQGLINVFTPVLRVLNQVIAKLTEAAKAFQRFTEIITGKKSQTNNMSGVATNTENATAAMGGLTSATNKAGGAAKKAEEAFHGLLGFDEINALTKAQDSSESGSDTSGGGLDDMSGFVDDTAQETDQELNPVLQKLIDKLKELRDLFKEGFKAGLGDVTLEPLKNAIEGIKTSLKEIFTDPGVLKAADNWANTVAYALGQITGAVASIGITIATNLFGGLNKYLESNKDLIKQRLINMFDISAEIWTIRGNFAQAFANIFSAFGGENGQRVTAAIIGIFANAWMGVNELCMKASRDVLDVITRPFIDNQAALKQALDDTLGVIATTLETIKGVVDETVSKASEVYDAHLKPMFDALATGLSSITATITAAYQTYILPVLDGLNEKFGTFMDQHLQPMINKFLELIGTLADGITKIWNELLVPFFNWYIQNVAPIVAEKLEYIGSILLTVFGVVADVIGGIFDALGGLIDFIVGAFTGDWQQAWDGIKTFFKGIWDAIYAIISTVWNAIYSVISSVISAVSTVINSVLNVIKTVFSTIFTSIKTTVTTIFNAIRSTITMVLATIQTGISTALNTIKTIFSTVFTSIKTTVTTIFNSMWSTIKGVINSIIGGVEGMANAVVNGVNTVIKALNNLSFDIPDWVPEFGGKTFGFNIPTLSTVSLPRLAMGGVVDGATPLIAGEAGKEAIVPLEKNTGWMDQIANRLGEMIVGSLNGFFEMFEGTGSEDWQTITTVVQIDGRTLVEQTDKVRRRKGYEMSPA